MNEKFLNLVLFLLDELKKEEDKIRENYLKEGIDLEKYKNILLSQLNEEKRKIKVEKANKFLKNFEILYNQLNHSFKKKEVNENLDFSLEFRRNSKNKKYPVTEDDKIKLKIIEKISKDKVKIMEN